MRSLNRDEKGVASMNQYLNTRQRIGATVVLILIAFCNGLGITGYVVTVERLEKNLAAKANASSVEYRKINVDPSIQKNRPWAKHLDLKTTMGANDVYVVTDGKKDYIMEVNEKQIVVNSLEYTLQKEDSPYIY